MENKFENDEDIKANINDVENKDKKNIKKENPFIYFIENYYGNFKEFIGEKEISNIGKINKKLMSLVIIDIGHNLYLKKNDLGLINRVGNSAINYISNVRIKIQRERDERLKFLTEKSRITKKYGYYKKLSSSHIYNSKEEIQKIIYKNYYLKNENDDIAPQKETIELDEIFEKRNYFEDKYEKYDKVFIAEPRLRNAIFRNDNCNIKPKKDNEKVIKFLLI